MRQALYRRTTRVLFGLALAVLALVGISRLIGRELPAPTAVFAYQGGDALTVVSVDIRTRVAYRHTYPQTFMRRDLLIMSSACLIPVTQQLDGSHHEGFLNLRTGLVHRYFIGGSIGPVSGPSPDRRSVWIRYTTARAQLQRSLLNLETGATLDLPLDKDRSRFSYAVWSPDSRYFYEVLTDPVTGDPQTQARDEGTWLVNAETGASIPLPPARGGYRWSPDSGSIALVEPGGGLAVLDLTGQVIHHLADFNDIHTITWEPASAHLLLLARNTVTPPDTTSPYAIYEWSPAENTVRPRAVSVPDVANARWWPSPDWSRMYHATPDAAPVIVDTRTGQTLLTLPEIPHMQWLFWSGDSRYVIIIQTIGSAYAVDIQAQTVTPLDLKMSSTSWQMQNPGTELGFYDSQHSTIGRILFTGAGIHIDTLEQPDADYATWCYPEDAA